MDAQAELLRYRLAQPVGGSGVASADLLIVTLHDDAGRVGVGFSYVLGGRDRLPLDAAYGMLERFVTGKPPAHPETRWREIAASFNRTGGGPYATALAALDVAGWDLYAKTLGVPLGVAMGGSSRAVPVYGSGFFSAGQDPDAAAAAALDYARRGVRSRSKLRAAGDASDAAALRALASAVSIPNMIDANEKLHAAIGGTQLVRSAAEVNAIFDPKEPLPHMTSRLYRALARVADDPARRGRALCAYGRQLEANPFRTRGVCAR